MKPPPQQPSPLLAAGLSAQGYPSDAPSRKTLGDFSVLDLAADIECLRLLRHAGRRQPKAA